MKRVTSFSPGVQVPAATLNSMQDYAMSLVLGGANNDFGSSQPLGTDGILWQASASLAAATLVQIDGTGDWRDRLVWGWCVQNTSAASGEGATTRIGQSTDYKFDFNFITQLAAVAGTKPEFFCGYTGKGAYSNTAGAGTLVSNANPPTRGTSGVTSWYVGLSSNGGVDSPLILYAEPGGTKLQIYNNTGSACQPTILLNFTAATGKRP